MDYIYRETIAYALETLEMPLINFKDITMEDIKRQYRNLAKKYHPDMHSIYSDSEQMKQVNEAYETIVKLVNKGIIKLKEKSINNYKEEKKEVKYSNVMQDLFNRLDKLPRIINNKKKDLLNTKAREVIDSSLEIINNLKEIINQENNIYSNILLENLVDLLEYYYSKVLNMNNYDINLDIDYNENTIFLYEKRMLYNNHKRLIFEEVKNLIDIFSKLHNYQINYDIYRRRENEIMKKIYKINEDALNIDIYMRVTNADKEKVNKRIKELK